MDKMYHQKTIELSKPTTGQAIMDAMETMAAEGGLEYRTKVNEGELYTLKVGFSSLSPEKHAVILTGEKLDRTELQPETNYEKIALGSNDPRSDDVWSGMVRAVRYYQEDVERAVNDLTSPVSVDILRAG